MESPLFESLSNRHVTDDWLSRRLTRALEAIQGGSASPTLDLEAFERELAGRNFEQAEPLEPLLDWTVSHLEKGAVQMTHPRYFGLFNPAPSYASECADRIAAALNPQICVLSHAPVAVLIERHVIRTVGQRAGLGDEAGGHFTSGGSEANATSVACALTRSLPAFAAEGCRAFSGQPRIYVSNESHLAWLKIAHVSGMGRRAVRLVNTDGMGQMSADALNAQIKADMDAGDVPVMIAATAGTTNAGMIDPLGPCADIARDYGLWLHVDAAWGGALIADASQRDVLKGIERADSVTIDAHKWFATTMGTGMFLTPHTDILEAAFYAKASYMPSGDAEVDYYLTSLQWSRRFAGLRLFLSLASGGWPAYVQHIRHGQTLIGGLNKTMTKAGWQVAGNPDMAVSCLIPPGESEEAKAETVVRIVDTIVNQGTAWVSVAILEGKPVIRVCVTNGNTCSDDVDRLATELIRLSAH